MINDASQFIQTPNECCEIFDDLLEPHVAEYIEDQIRKVHWKYDYPSNSRIAIQSHWHVLCGFNEEEVIQNAHTNGVEPHMHRDDGDFTMMYYPRLDWKPEWLGGTAIWDDEGKNIDRYCNYIGNRLIIFPAKNNHQAMPVSKFCYELRPIVVFKLFVS